jgi:hypothetical protein
MSTSLAASIADFPEVGMDDGWLTVGGEKFRVVGVGYQFGGRPGLVPWDVEIDLELVRLDFRRIKEAGFNTIRTWTPLTDGELEIAAEYGLWVIQSCWYDVQADFNDASFQGETLALVEEMTRRSARHPNILFYMLGNEPHGDAVLAAGTEHMNAFFTTLVAKAKQYDPDRLVTFANCVFGDFLMPEPWDLVAQNVYPYSPVTIERTLGFRHYIELMKAKVAPTRPLIVTEFGLSVSPTGDGRGYGGNSIQEQTDGVVALWDDVLNAGASGGAAFMWLDGWWKAGDPDTHDDTAEEWYGFLECDTNVEGVPRPVLAALTEYNRAVRTQPRDGTAHGASIPVEVWSPEAQSVEVRLDDGSWQALVDEKPWWRTSLDTARVAEGAHVVHTRMKDAGGEYGSEKEAKIRVVRSADGNVDRYGVAIVDLPRQWPVNQAMPLRVEVRDRFGAAVEGKTVSVSRFYHSGWHEVVREVQTNAQGLATAELPAHPLPGMMSVAAAVDGDIPERNDTGWKQGTAKRYGDYQHFELVEAESEGEDCHSADQNCDQVISLTEVLRTIQLFNSGAYHCADSPDGTEDGYLMGGGDDHSCLPHDSDYNLQDWHLGFSELLRLVQLHNSPGYVPCFRSMDGFCLD